MSSNSDSTLMRQNKPNGSVSDHLANERTFLAWIRTSMGVMAFGFVVVKFTLFIKQLSFVLQKPLVIQGHGYSTVIGIFLVGFGALLSLMAFIRYRITARQIRDSDFTPSILLITVLTISIILMGILLVIYLIHSINN